MSFLSTCRLPAFLRRCARVIVCGTGIAIALSSCGAEWLYTFGVTNHHLGALQLAARLFPIDQRYRDGPSELFINGGDDREAIAILRREQLRDPNSPVLAASLFVHLMRVGDNIGASVEFATLYRLAPKSEMVKSLLANRRREVP